MGMDFSVAAEAQAVSQAVTLMQLGARRSVIEAETGLSGDRLTRLFREVTGQAPSRGQLPHSPEWFLGRRVAMQVALFDAWHRRLTVQCGATGLQALVRAYRFYLEELQRLGQAPQLDFTRAWSLQRFVTTGLLVHQRCVHCGLLHLALPNSPVQPLMCPACQGSSSHGAGRRCTQASTRSRQARAKASATFNPSTPADKMPPA